jgi:hypothetical protein|tara:strand:+ start:416 stop:1072 length:657 start_codon:yes stop_codon:yes gene_type:complete
MGQVRAKTGLEFEVLVRSREGFERYIKAPRIKWTGTGKNNMERLLSVNKNPNKFKPIMSESKFIKADARDKNGVLYEIKKYNISDLNTYKLYSEPIIKVAPTRSKWGKGDPYYDAFESCDEYNKFIYKITKTRWWRKYNKTILKNIYTSNSGIFSKDGFIPYTDLKFKWVINKGEYGPIFDGYNRLTIIFKIKDKPLLVRIKEKIITSLQIKKKLWIV